LGGPEGAARRADRNAVLRSDAGGGAGFFAMRRVGRAAGRTTGRGRGWIFWACARTAWRLTTRFDARLTLVARRVTLLGMRTETDGLRPVLIDGMERFLLAGLFVEAVRLVGALRNFPGMVCPLR